VQGGRAVRRPERIAARARRAQRSCAPRAAGNDDINDQAALDAIKSILDANKARPLASVRRAFQLRPRSAALLGASALYAPSPRVCLPFLACHDPRLLHWCGTCAVALKFPCGK
jgi:hypothetical protein